jgi:hypothetical protein
MHGDYQFGHWVGRSRPVSPGGGGESVVGAGPVAAADRRLHGAVNHGQDTLSSHWEKEEERLAESKRKS